MAKFGFPHHSRALTFAALVGLGGALAGCLGNTSLDDLNFTKPTGTAFDNALYANYKFLALSFGDVGEAKRAVFDFNGSVSLNETDKNVASLANAFAAKAVEAARGEFVDPEPSASPATHEVRDRLLRALEPARDAFPRDAARVQADYDCWIMNSAVPSQKTAAERCRASLDKILPKLEAALAALQAKQDAEAQKAAQAAQSARAANNGQGGEAPTMEP